MISDLNKRARDIFGRLVDIYLEKGEPVGSRTLSKALQGQITLSSASIRHVMQDLEEVGFLEAPHVSAGRRPTQSGLRFYIKNMLGDSKLSRDEQEQLERKCVVPGRPIRDVFERTSNTLSSMCQSAGLVLVPKQEAPLEDIQFIAYGSGKAIAVMVFKDKTVEDYLIDLPSKITPEDLQEASNYLKGKLSDRTLSEVELAVQGIVRDAQRELGQLTAKVVEAGLLIKPAKTADLLIFRGVGNMLQNVSQHDIESIRALLNQVENGETAGLVLKLIQEQVKEQVGGAQIHLGAETALGIDNLSLVLSAYRDDKNRIIGATGVIGPTRLNYRRVVPLVEHSAKLIGQRLINLSL